MWAMIGTWRMALESIQAASDLLHRGGKAEEAVVSSIAGVEDFPYYKSVGYGGLPNEDMVVELDAGFMDGDELRFGAVAGVQNIKNPIQVAQALSKENLNNFLVGRGAEKYAMLNGFAFQNMLTDRAAIHYLNRLHRLKKEREDSLHPYNSHDTVGIAALDTQGCLCVGTSTSGLFMKRESRVGDSPVVGSGFYLDSEVGAATATGLGEDLMKGCISYQIVQAMKTGVGVQEACDLAVKDLQERLQRRGGGAGDLSVVALDRKGNFGVASNIDNFSFVYASEHREPTVYLAIRGDEHTAFQAASEEWMKSYMEERMKPIDLEED